MALMVCSLRLLAADEDWGGEGDSFEDPAGLPALPADVMSRLASWARPVEFVSRAVEAEAAMKAAAAISAAEGHGICPGRRALW